MNSSLGKENRLGAFLVPGHEKRMLTAEPSALFLNSDKGEQPDILHGLMQGILSTDIFCKKISIKVRD